MQDRQRGTPRRMAKIKMVSFCGDGGMHGAAMPGVVLIILIKHFYIILFWHPCISCSVPLGGGA